VTAHVDARGMRCPWPVLRLARAMRAGDSVTIAADDPAAPGEIAALAAANGWQVTENEGLYRVTRPNKI
jgi:tRNA 2-thiouridine synthesizing protein A